MNDCLNRPVNTACCEQGDDIEVPCKAATLADNCCNNDLSVENQDSVASCCSTVETTGLQARLIENIATAWSLILAIPLLVLLLDSIHLREVISIASSALAGTAPFIVFAVLLISYLKASGAETVIARAFEGRENRMIVLSALLGGLAPFCSCEVIPFVAGLLAVGTPLSAVMAFWLSSPLIDPASILVTAAALGWEFAVAKTIAAVMLGLFGGFAVKLLIRSGTFTNPLRNSGNTSCDSGGCSSTKPFAGKPEWKFWKQSPRIETFRHEAGVNALFLFKWLSLAYLLEALLVLYVPSSLIGGIVGGEGLTPILLGAIVGMPAYLNSYAAPPLVAGLMEQGMSAGSAMAFMISGAISSIPAMTAVWSLVKKQVFAAYLLFGVSGAVICGLLYSALAG